MKTQYSVPIGILIIIAGMFFLLKPKAVLSPSPVVTSTAFTTYVNATKDNIVVNLPFPGAVTGKEFSVIGKARGTWFFEASFPIELLDKDGKVLWAGPAQAQGVWMTEDFVPFRVDITVTQSYIGKATLILRKDNPSGDPVRDASISFPITVEY